MARILVTALYGNVKGGGSGSYINCLIDALELLGHRVIYSKTPSLLNKLNFDFCISSHVSQLKQIVHWDIPKIHIMQGIVPLEEQPISGATHYVSISNEVQHNALTKGFKSIVIRQPIKTPSKYKPSNKDDILFIKNNATCKTDWEIPNLKMSNINVAINDQIRRSKMVISLGRGALESMAFGRNVIIADNRTYQGSLGDGYITPDNFFEIEKNNFSGRRYKHNATNKWISQEIKKYNSKHGRQLFDIIKEHNDYKMIAKQLIELI